MNNLSKADLVYVNTLATCIAKGENPAANPPSSLPIDVQPIITRDQSSLSSEDKVAELEDLKEKIQAVHDGGVPPSVFQSQHPQKTVRPMDATTEQQYQKTVKNIETLEHLARSKDLIERNPTHGPADTTLLIGGVEIKCHKAHLTASCGLLRIGNEIDKFYDAEKTAKGKEIDPQLYNKFCKIVSEETHPEVMSAILRYLYTGKVEIAPELLPAYYETCEKLKVLGREQMGGQLVITKENAEEFKKVADKISDKTVAKSIKDLVHMTEEKGKIPAKSLNKIASFVEVELDKAKETGRKEFEEKPVGKAVASKVSNFLKQCKILIKILLAILIVALSALIMFTLLAKISLATLPVIALSALLLGAANVSLFTGIFSGFFLLWAYADWQELQDIAAKNEITKQKETL